MCTQGFRAAARSELPHPDGRRGPRAPVRLPELRTHTSPRGRRGGTLVRSRGVSVLCFTCHRLICFCFYNFVNLIFEDSSVCTGPQGQNCTAWDVHRGLACVPVSSTLSALGRTVTSLSLNPSVFPFGLQGDLRFASCLPLEAPMQARSALRPFRSPLCPGRPSAAPARGPLPSWSQLQRRRPLSCSHSLCCYGYCRHSGASTSLRDRKSKPQRLTPRTPRMAKRTQAMAGVNEAGGGWGPGASLVGRRVARPL